MRPRLWLSLLSLLTLSPFALAANDELNAQLSQATERYISEKLMGMEAPELSKQIDRLLKQGAQSQFPLNESGPPVPITPLGMAISAVDPELVHRFLKAKPNLDLPVSRDMPMPPLIMVISFLEQGQPDTNLRILDDLLAHGANPNIRGGMNGGPALQMFSLSGLGPTPLQIAGMKRLIKAGADVNAVDLNGDGLATNAWVKHLVYLKFLVESKVDLNRRNRLKETPMHWVCPSQAEFPSGKRDREAEARIALLKTAGVSVNGSADAGRTGSPLYATLPRAAVDCVQALLAQGASADDLSGVKDAKGEFLSIREWLKSPDGQSRIQRGMISAEVLQLLR